MTELSALGVKITSSGVVKTTNELDAFAIASRKAAQANKPINVKATGINAKILNDVRALDKALAKASARAGIGVKVTGTAEAIASLNAVSAAAAKARAASNVNAKVTGGGGPSSGDVSAVNGLKGAVLGLVSAYTLLQGVKVYASLTDESKMLTAQLRLATSETGSFAKAQEDVRRIAAGTRADLDSTAALYGKLMLNSKQLGITQQEAARATETVAKAFKVSGASTVEASQGTRQLVQALQSGVLRGDEFNTMAEAAPRLQKLLAESLGVTQGQLRKMAEEGELTSDKLTKAFTDKRFTQGLDDEFAQLPVTFGDAMTQIRNAAVITFGAFDEGGQFSKSITSFLIGGTKGMADWENAARSLGQTIAVEFAKITAFAESVTAGIRLFGDALIWVNSIPGVSTVTSWLGDVISQVSELASWLNPMNALFNIIGRVGEKAAQQKQRDLVADSQNSRINAMMGFKGNGQFRDDSPAITRNTAAVTKATKARKGLTDAERDAKRAADELKRAYDQKVKSADDYIASLTRENQEFGKTAKEIRLMEVARRMEAAATDEQRAAIQRLSDQREMNISTKELADAMKMNDQRRREIQLINDETELQRKAGDARMEALRGLSGDALENELARINDEYEIQNILLRAQAAAANDAANAVHILAMANAEIAQVRQAQGQDGAERAFEQNRRKAIGVADEVADIIGGGFGDGAREMIRILDETLPSIFADLGAQFGKQFEAFSKGAKTGAVFGAMTGSATGGAIGGGLGQIGGEAIAGALGKLGKFAGPLGAIAGGLLGGIIGGMLKKTPKASATVSIIAGEAMETAITGNKSSLKKIAGGMADSVIAGLAGVAETLGADLAGNAKVSIGMRKKSYRVDETGRGRTKKGAGVQDFGEDQASAIAYAIQVAIKQGVLDGLSDSMNRLIVADGDLQAQLQKALSFKSVFDELAQKDDPAKWAQDAITKWHDGMAKIFAEAGATAAELAELERLTGLKRADAAKAAADALEEASRAAFEKERPRRELEIQIMELTGQASRALAATRAMELEQMDASLRPLQERVNALKDQAAATEAAATLEAGRLELLKELWAEQGRESVLRLHQLQAMDESYRAIQLEIWALQDQKKAAEELAAAQQKIAEEARGLQDRIDQLTGNTVAIRERELAAVDASNRALVQRIHALEDEAAAAAKAKAIADEADGLQSRWLQLIGDTAALRERELSALDPTNRALMSRIFAEEDRQAAEEKARAAAEEYTNSLRETVSGLSDMAQRIRDIAQEIREYKASLTEESAVAGNGYARTLAQFQSTSRMAALGNENSLSSFIGDAQAFLASAKENARSSLDYRRAIGMVSSGADSAIGGANALAASADAQAAALNATIAQTEVITSLGGSTVDLLAATNAALTDVVTPAIEDTIGGGIDALRLEIAGMRRDATERRDEEKAEAVAMVTNISAVRNILDRVNRGDSLAISLEDLISVLVANTTAQPVPTSEVV
jgi:tape measure domain-containing protein